jgi:hypothetical protein
VAPAQQKRVGFDISMFYACFLVVWFAEVGDGVKIIVKTKTRRLADNVIRDFNSVLMW